ncbi:class III lanthipeptide [Staphylococcus felis]|nr:class III lanthipeptide [Staphylococcus felis]
MEQVLELQKLSFDQEESAERGWTPTTTTVAALSTLSNNC